MKKQSKKHLSKKDKQKILNDIENGIYMPNRTKQVDHLMNDEFDGIYQHYEKRIPLHQQS